MGDVDGGAVSTAPGGGARASRALARTSRRNRLRATLSGRWEHGAGAGRKLGVCCAQGRHHLCGAGLGGVWVCGRATGVAAARAVDHIRSAAVRNGRRSNRPCACARRAESCGFARRRQLTALRGAHGGRSQVANHGGGRTRGCRPRAAPDSGCAIHDPDATCTCDGFSSGQGSPVDVTTLMNVTKKSLSPPQALPEAPRRRRKILGLFSPKHADKQPRPDDT
jgi:hypothetical protein